MSNSTVYPDKMSPVQKYSLFEIFEIIFGVLVAGGLALALALLIASSSTAVSLNTKHSMSSSSPIAQEMLLANAERTRAFVRGGLDQADLSQELMPGIAYDESEISHLHDVKNILVPVIYAAIPLAILFVLMVVRSFLGDKARVLRPALLIANTMMVVIFVVLALVGVYAFDFIFEKFHHILFPQGNWMFAYDSLLIQTFPLQFWINSSLIVVSGMLFMVVAYALLAFTLKRYLKTMN